MPRAAGRKVVGYGRQAGQPDGKVRQRQYSLIASDDAAPAVNCLTSHCQSWALATLRIIMRIHPITAAATFILVVVGVKLFFLSGPIAADVDSTRSVSVDLSEMHHKLKNLPVEKIHDMTFVFSSGG